MRKHLNLVEGCTMGNVKPTPLHRDSHGNGTFKKGRSEGDRVEVGKGVSVKAVNAVLKWT